MLGTAVYDVLQAEGCAVITSTRPIEEAYDARSMVANLNPAVIINCAGVRPGTRNDAEMAFVNGVLPHLLAQTGVRMVHMSTDCVYSGRSAPSRDHPDPVDLYGRSKLAGESLAPHVLNVRGSFIGPRHGFLRWLLDAEGEVPGWENAWWNGTYVDTMAEALVALALTNLTGVLHVASTTSISKADMARYLVNALSLSVTVQGVTEPVIHRALAVEWPLPPVPTMLAELVRVREIGRL